MNVLSLFDGMSCGQIALERVGIKVDNYFASEIDKSAIKVTQHNYPKTIQLGDVTNVYSSNLPKIDLLIGGSPCQGFSFAGKQLNFNDDRSKLFFEFVRLKNELKSKYFLLENVDMKQEYMDIISEYLGVLPVKINSNLFSAQNRVRWYWTNIPFSLDITDMGIKLKDIIFDNSYKLFSDNRIERTKMITKNYVKWDISGKGYWSQQDRAYFLDKKMCTLPKSNPSNKLNIVIDYENGIYRRLHPIEAERCQTVPDNYTNVFHVSENKRLEMLGNGWTVDAIAHIFKGLK